MRQGRLDAVRQAAASTPTHPERGKVGVRGRWFVSDRLTAVDPPITHRCPKAIEGEEEEPAAVRAGRLEGYCCDPFRHGHAQAGAGRCVGTSEALE